MSEDEVDGVGDGHVGVRGRRSPVIIGVLVLVAVTAGAVVWGLSQRGAADDAEAQLARQRDAVLVAGGFVEALMSYDHEDLGTQQAAVEGFATTRFRDEYDEAFTSDVRDQIIAERASSTVTVEDVFLAIDEGDDVTAIVHARSMVKSDGGASAELESYLRVRLLRSDGTWRVDDLTSLGSQDLSAPLVDPAANAAEDESEEGGPG